MRNREKVTIKGQELFLYERNAKDVLDILELIKSKEEFDMTENIFVNVQVLLSSLRPNFDSLKWFQILKRFKLKKMFTYKWFANNLSISEISSLSLIVSRLEGADNKKKVV